MRVLRSSIQFAVLIMLFIFLACTSTKFSTVWMEGMDEAYQERPGKILVINEIRNPAINPATRKIFEDELVKALKERGVDAVISYTSMPGPIVSDKDAIAARATEVGADTVLISKIHSSNIDKSSGQSIGKYWYLNIDTQTEIYDMKSNRLVLSATAKTSTLQGESYTILMQSYVKDLVNKLSQLGLF